MKLTLLSILFLATFMAAQVNVRSLSLLQSANGSISTSSLSDVFNSKTERYREVYNHQLELLRSNKTGRNFIIKMVDAEVLDEEVEEDENHIPFFRWLAERKQAKFDKIKAMKARGHEKMLNKLEKWNMTGMKEKFYGTQTGVNVIEVEDGQNLEAAWSTILQDEDVEFAEIDMSVSLFSDCRLLSNWGYQHTRANHAMEILNLSQRGRNSAAEILVAVIDSGVDYDHPLLDGRVWLNEAELNGVEGVDDDGNGYIDDIWGWNFAENTNNVRDEDGHGTHVAGIIAGLETRDPDPFSGVAPNVVILPCRFTESSDSGSVSAAIQCMEYAFEMEADILSNSWGGVGVYSFALEEAMNRASRLGRLQINAAGNAATNNDGSREQATYPAAYDTDIIIAVAAIDNEGSLTEVSNFGSSSVDIGAPGESIWSTHLNGELSRMGGTSQATPYVSAAAAVLLGACREQGRQCLALEIKQAILDGAIQDSELNGRVLTGGYLDIPNAARILGLVNESSLLERNDDEVDVCGDNQPRIASLFAFACVVLLYAIL